MSKRNHYLSPAITHDSRLNNSVVRGRKCKRPNALKHGFYTGAPLIPGEDPDEFNNLYAELIDEWKPSGPTLRDGVFELADLRWKQRRLRRFMQTKLSLTAFDELSPNLGDGWGQAAAV
jgi:hypothetical protein